LNPRPITQEEYAVAGVSMRHCSACGEDKAHNASGWVYYREDRTPKVLCGGCFDWVMDHGTIAQKALFASPAAAVCDSPPGAHGISGLQQITPDPVERAFEMFRDMSPNEIRALGMQIPTRAGVGDCLEWFGPVRWWSILKCLAWLREMHDISLRHFFGRWEKLQGVLNDTLPGVDHGPWRKRLADFAAAEFLFRYSVLLSDAVEAAHIKAKNKKTNQARHVVFEECKTFVCGYPPPASLDGAAGELARFTEYVDATVERLA
jgi:hypothetical protein